MNCENCENKHEGNYGSGRFCSSKCARGFSTKKNRKEINEKVSKTLTKFDKIKKDCENCGKEFIKKRKKTRFCSVTCSVRNTNSLPGYRKNLSRKMKKRVELGIHSGWQSRNIISYPEKFFIKVLDNNNLKYELNFKVKKSDLGMDCNSCYFLDFFFPEKNIDLEIDGKQHEREERKKSDMVRDGALLENGYKVYRIKWKSINNKQGKEYIKNEIQKFLKFYNE